MNRFYCQNITNDTVELSGAEAAHLLNVLRLKTGDRAELFDGAGTLAKAVITGTKKRSAKLKIETSETIAPRSESRVIIAASISKGQRFDWMISKCTELGVDHIVPIICDRTVKLAKGSNAVERFNNLAVSAAKQCKRLFLPIIDEPKNLSDAINKLKNDYPNACAIFGGLNTETKPISTIDTDADVIAITGPEGGFTNEEEKLLLQNSAIAVKLTDTILRTETAAITFAAILCVERDKRRYSV